MNTPVVWGDGTVAVAGRFTYAWADRRRPRIHPLVTPAGHVLSRDEPADHPWHHGLWFTIKFLDGDNFWEEMAPYGVLRHRDRPAVTATDEGGTEIAGTIDWIRGDRVTVAMVESRRLTYFDLGPDHYAIDLDTTVVPTADVRLDRTPFTTWGGYGGLTLRGAADLVDTTLTLADGSKHERLTGEAAPWCDLTGTASAGTDSATPAGLALFDHPENLRFPTPFYASTFDQYGEGGWTNFFNAAFLWDGPLEVAAGEPLRVRHRALVHDGEMSVTELQGQWDRWVAERD